MKAFAMLSMALLVTSCLAIGDKSTDKAKDASWELTLKLGDDLDDPPTTDAPPTTEVTTEKVPQPVEIEKKVEVKVPNPVEVIKEVPVIVEKRVIVVKKVPYPVKVVQKEYVKVPYPVFVKKPVYIERNSHGSYRYKDYNYQQKQRGWC